MRAAILSPEEGITKRVCGWSQHWERRTKKGTQFSSSLPDLLLIFFFVECRMAKKPYILIFLKSFCVKFPAVCDPKSPD